MRKAAFTLLATFVLALMMALSTAVASAGWEYVDCPPVSKAATEHASSVAKAKWANVSPEPASPAVSGNPGNKFGDK